TNRTFGLGPPGSKAPSLMHLGPKPAGEVLGPKPAGDGFGRRTAGEVLGPKPAGEVLGPKPAGEVLGPLGSETGAILASLSSDAQMAGLAVSTLLTQIAFALAHLERAAAAIESAAAEFLFAPMYGALLPESDYKAAVRLRFAEEFGVMKEVSLQARRSIRRILAHPLYGLGPGPEGLEQEDRDELATAAGLSRRNLRLLWANLDGPRMLRNDEAMDIVRAFQGALLVALVVQPSAECQPTRDTAPLRREIRTHIDEGRYVQAEDGARALLASLGELSNQNRLEVNRAADLLVEALARNGRGAEPYSRTLAEEMVRRREAAEDADSSALATALRNLGDVLFQGGFYREA